jgi:anti-sigma-K factor RskA
MQSAGPGHENWEDATAAYLLGALDEHETTAFEDHLAGCPACRDEVAHLLPAARALPISVEPIDPPPALKARIMAEVEREAALLAAAGPQADRPAAKPRRERRSWFGMPMGAIAALACVALLAGLGLGAVLFRAGGRTLPFTPSGNHAVAELDVSGDKAVLVARGLPSPGSGRTYQVWLKRPGEAPQPTAALFTPRRDGSATATVTGKLAGGDQVLVTAEPDGGSPAPTSKPILAATMT